MFEKYFFLSMRTQKGEKNYKFGSLLITSANELGKISLWNHIRRAFLLYNFNSIKGQQLNVLMMAHYVNRSRAKSAYENTHNTSHVSAAKGKIHLSRRFYAHLEIYVMVHLRDDLQKSSAINWDLF